MIGDEWLMFDDWLWMTDHDNNADESLHLCSSYLHVPLNLVLAAPQLETRSVPWCSSSYHVAVTSQKKHPHSGDSEILAKPRGSPDFANLKSLGYPVARPIKNRSFLGRGHPIWDEPW